MGGCHVENNKRKSKKEIIEGSIISQRKSIEENNAEEDKKIDGDNDLIKSQNNKENSVNENENNVNESKFIEDNNNINNDITENNENNNNINYWLVCPDCSERSPHIEKLYYDKETKNFSVKYSCICHDNVNYPKEALLLNIISNREPQNLCIIHPGEKLVNFCKDCGKAICNICKSETHDNHTLEENNANFSKEDSVKMLEIIKQKEEQFNKEIDKNEKKMENGINNEIEKLNIKKQKYKDQFEDYRNDNQKTFFFLKNLCNRYINNANENNSNN